jgi:hypothetical protein
MEEKVIEKVEEATNKVVDKIEETVENKINETCSEELSEQEYLKKSKLNHKDILKLFYFVYIFTFLLLVAKFVSFVFFKIYIDIDMSKLANTLNASIIFIGSAEGIRSIMYTAREEVGKSVSVPAYKLKFLFGYLISFAIITIAAVVFEFFVKYKFNSLEIDKIPNFNANDFINGLLSNTLSYLVARYGDKVTSNIDLSNLPFFKRKN